jgi:hypothetical protein
MHQAQTQPAPEPARVSRPAEAVQSQRSPRPAPAGSSARCRLRCLTQPAAPARRWSAPWLQPCLRPADVASSLNECGVKGEQRAQHRTRQVVPTAASCAVCRKKSLNNLTEVDRALHKHVQTVHATVDAKQILLPTHQPLEQKSRCKAQCAASYSKKVIGAAAHLILSNHILFQQLLSGVAVPNLFKVFCGVFACHSAGAAVRAQTTTLKATQRVEEGHLCSRG